MGTGRTLGRALLNHSSSLLPPRYCQGDWESGRGALGVRGGSRKERWTQTRDRVLLRINAQKSEGCESRRGQTLQRNSGSQARDAGELGRVAGNRAPLWALRKNRALALRACVPTGVSSASLPRAVDLSSRMPLAGQAAPVPAMSPAEKASLWSVNPRQSNGGEGLSECRPQERTGAAVAGKDPEGLLTVLCFLSPKSPWLSPLVSWP